MVATIPDIQPTNEDDAPEVPSSTNNIPTTRGNRRNVVSARCPIPSNNKGKGKPRKTGGSRPRVANQEESDEEEDDIEESDEEEEGEVDSSIGGGVSVVGRIVDQSSNSRPALIPRSTDQVPLPVVDDDYDNV